MCRIKIGDAIKVVNYGHREVIIEECGNTGMTEDTMPSLVGHTGVVMTYDVHTRQFGILSNVDKKGYFVNKDQLQLISQL